MLMAGGLGDYDRIEYTVGTSVPFERIVLHEEPNDGPNIKVYKISKRGAREKLVKEQPATATLPVSRDHSITTMSTSWSIGPFLSNKIKPSSSRRRDALGE
jgi:hypothetical protein